ncbi:SGNH/GDSL hydrolase family protein [Pseudomonas promysalinigenes]
MADQTQRLEIATVRAEVGSNILYRFSNDAAAAAAIPTESGDIKNLKQVILQIQADAAEKISISTTIYPTVAAGLAATADQEIFLVQSDDANEIYTVWKNEAGTAVNTGKSALSSEAIQQALDASNEAAQAAEEAADTATARTAGFLAPSPTAPVLRDNGLPLQVGDRYLNTEVQIEYVFKSDGWQANNIDGQVLASPDGSDLVGAISPVTGQVSTVQQSLNAIRGGGQNNLGYLSAVMASGGQVSICCYGDSTVDGNQTSGWVANPVVNGDAVGGSDHERTAPNAWPAKLKSILTEMFSNQNVKVWNAGYSGQRMDNGWAVRNYETAVINNPFYGVPDICFVAFGLNDIAQPGSQIASHAEQTRILLRKILSSGTLPILLTCDPHMRNDSRVNTESRRQIDQAKRTVAGEFGIPLIDIGLAVKEWAECNSDGYHWGDEQSDGLHFSDNGHAFKAGFLAALFFNDTVFVDGAIKRLPVSSWDSRLSNLAPYASRYRFSNTIQGGNPWYQSAAPANSAVQTMWVFNKSKNTKLVYRGIDNEGYYGGSFSGSPKIRVTEKIGGVVTEKYPAQSGFSFKPDFRVSDSPYIFGKLPYGLSKVEYVSVSGSSIFYGNFELAQSKSSSPRKNALSNSGVLVESFPAGSIGISIVPESDDLENVYSVMSEGGVEFLVDATLPIESGVVLGHGSGFASGATSNKYGSVTGWLLYRKANDVRVYVFAWLPDNTVKYDLLGSANVLIPWDSSSRKTFRVTVSRQGQAQVIKVYEGYTSQSPTLSINVDYASAPLRFSGASGGLYYNGEAAAVAAQCQLHQLLIK